MSRVVLDTNVLVAALRSRRGASFQILKRIGSEQFEPCVSVPLVLEYEAVLREQSSTLNLSAPDIEAVLDYVVRVSHHQEVFYLWRPRLRDPKDDMVLEVAVASQARRIVTHNVRDFADASQYSLPVMTPGQFLAELGESE